MANAKKVQAPKKRQPKVPPMAAPEKNGPVKLTKYERIMLSGLVARDKELQALMQPLQQDFFDVKRHIEENHGFDVGALDSTHALNVDKGVVEELRLPPSDPEPEHPDATSGPEANDGEVSAPADS
jgi:hypothetical protein